MTTRRTVLKNLGIAPLAGIWGACSSTPDTPETVDTPSEPTNPLAREVGVTTSSLGSHVALHPSSDQIALFDMPRVLLDEFDMRVIDLNTTTLGESGLADLDRLRNEAAKTGSHLINLKMNQQGLNMDSPDEAVRAHAVTEYKKSIDVAAQLGCRWARPLPLADEPDFSIHVKSYRELADYGAEKGVEMLVENFGWMQDDPDSTLRIIEAVGHNISPCPDTGNWDSEELRFEGLARIFPTAVTCDFKAREISPEGDHPLYDLKRCFETGWNAGYKGPWCLEHANPDRDTLFGELTLLRDMLHQWMAEAA